MASEYDSLLEEPPKTSEYDQLLAPEPSTTPSFGEIAGRAGKAAWETAKSLVPTSLEQARDLAVSLVPPLQAAKSTFNTLSAIVHGESPVEPAISGIPIVQRIPEIAAAEKTDPFSEERFKAGFGTIADVAMLAGIGHGIAKGIPKTLAETAGIAKPEIAPEPPLTTEAKAATPDVPITPEVAPVAVPEPQPVPEAPVSTTGSGIQETAAPLSTETVTPEEVTTNAQQISEPTSVHGDVLNAPGTQESVREVPTGVGGEGVQARGQGEALQQAPQEVNRPEPEVSTFSVEMPKDVFGSEHTPVSSFLIDNVGGVVSKSAASKAGKLKANPDLWDDAQNLSHPTHNKIYNANGELPDTAAQALYDAGLIKDPSPTTMWKAIGDESKSARSVLKSQQGGIKDVQQQAGQAKDFGTDQKKAWKSGEPLVQVRDLQVGDTVTVKGESLKVTDIDPDNFDVTLEDGKKYGVQTVKDNTVIYGQHETTLPAPKLLAGETQGDLISSTQKEDFALVGEKGTDFGAQQAAIEKAQAERAQSEKGQLELGAAPPKTEAVAPPTPAEIAAKNSGEETGIAARYREEEQPGSVIEGVGKTPDEARAFGHDFINKGGNPYDAIANKGPRRELWQDVGIARAEYERLGNEKRAAEAQLEANPNDPQAQMAFDNADLAQRQWSKDAQPILTRAGDALRAATRSYPREINTFSDFTDIVNDHFKGEVELTPEKRSELQKAVKAIKKGNVDATEARAKVTDQAVKKAGGKVMSFDDLKADLQGAMTKLMEDCVL